MSTTTPPDASPVRRIPLPLAARALTVQRVEDLSPTLRRVALGGPDLEGFAAHGPADHVKVFFPASTSGSASGPTTGPASSSTEVTMPVLVDGRWTNREDPTLVYRDYTVRTVDPTSGELVLEMVTGDHGPAARWASRAAVGDRLGVLGPRGSMLPPLDRDWYVLAADETGLPALTNWLDRLPGTARVQVFVEVEGPEHQVALPTGPRTDVTWLHRGSAAPGATTALADAVVSAPFAGADDGPGWCWAAAEASTVRAIRTHLTAVRGLDRSSFGMTGYWRRGEANFDHHSPDA